jgi:hypothetical protein
MSPPQSLATGPEEGATRVPCVCARTRCPCRHTLLLHGPGPASPALQSCTMEGRQEEERTLLQALGSSACVKTALEQQQEEGRAAAASCCATTTTSCCHSFLLTLQQLLRTLGGT